METRYRVTILMVQTPIKLNNGLSRFQSRIPHNRSKNCLLTSGFLFSRRGRFKFYLNSMAQQLHPWLRSFIEPILREALEWKRNRHSRYARPQTVPSTAGSPKSRELSTFHDDGSNLRIKVVFDDCSRKFVQLLSVC